MRALVIFAAVALAAPAATSASAQDGLPQPPQPSYTYNRMDGTTMGILSTSPSRIDSSRREMNRNRETAWATNPTPSQLRTMAQRSLRRGGYQCTIAEVDLVAQMLDKTLIVEVACTEGGGVVIAGTDPVQVTDCVDLVNATGAIGPCRIPRNVTLVSAARH